MIPGKTDDFEARPDLDDRLIADWAEKLRVACMTLRKAPPWLIRAMVLTQPLRDVSWEADAVADLSGHLAAEYDLSAAIERSGRRVTIRLTRRGDAEGT